MKHHHFFAAMFAVAVLTAVPLSAASSLITPDGVRYTLEQSPEAPQIEIIRVAGDVRARLIVPSTQDAGKESQAQLGYDSAHDTLFVVWSRESAGYGEVRYATLSAAGHWSPARLIVAGSPMYRGLQFVLTHGATDDAHATFMHVAWWSISGRLLAPEYALFAFENGRFVSAEVENLNDLLGLDAEANPRLFGYEPDRLALHPPLALDRDGETVDVAFGSLDSTSINRLNVAVRRVGGDVRIWKPLGRRGSRTPGAGLTSITGAPVQAFMNNGHLALYTMDEEFRFVVLRNSGSWSPVHTLPIDEQNSAQDLLRELKTTVEELLEDDDGEDEESR